MKDSYWEEWKRRVERGEGEGEGGGGRTLCGGGGRRKRPQPDTARGGTWGGKEGVGEGEAPVGLGVD